MNVHFSSQRLDWKTPQAVYQILDAEFKFNDDPCPVAYDDTELIENEVKNGLKREWGTSSFVNPPYGHGLKFWIAKGWEEYQKGKTVVFLIPSRTDTRWWHDYCMKATEIRFIKGRLKFDDQENSAPFPSCIVIFRSNDLLEKEYSETGSEGPKDKK